MVHTHTHIHTYEITYYTLKDFCTCICKVVTRISVGILIIQFCSLYVHIFCFTLDCSLNVQPDMLCRVGHVCAACFIRYNSAFRLLWLHCFKPYEHQFVGKVNAVYDMSKLGLCRVRKPPASIAEQCPVKSCANGRKCAKAHSVIELKYWNNQQGMYIRTQLHIIYAL